MRLASFLVLALAIPAFGADEWVRLSTPHFEIYTTAGERKGREAILYFEQVRSFVVDITHATWDQAVPVRIIAFKSDKQFRPFSPSEAAAAFYTRNESRDYIVMQDLETEHFPVAIHEYFHLVIQHSGLKLPTWLNEGWADVFSTLQPFGKQVMIGQAIPGHVQVLMQEKWLDFNTLTSVDQKSANYNERNRAGLFYSESWALTHMLYLGAGYHENFGKFLSAVAQGKSAAEACQIAYDRTQAKVFSDLQSYLRQNSINVGMFPTKLEKSAEDAVLSLVPELESSVALADLLAVTGKRDQAKSAYEKLAAQYPGTSEISRSLGYLAWQGGNTELARKYFEEALPGATDPQMCYHLAMLYHDANQTDRVVAALQKALMLKPDYLEARMQLGFANLNRKDYPGAIASFTQIKRVTPEHAAALFNGLAYAYAQNGDLNAARTNLDNALKWAKTDSEKAQADQLKRYLDARDAAVKRNAGNPLVAQTVIPNDTGRPLLGRGVALAEPAAEKPADSAIPPPSLTERNPFVRPGEVVERVEGEARELQCEGTHVRLVVEVGTATMIFEITDPKKIMLRHESVNQFDFMCGPQKKFHVAVEYVPDATLDKGVAGAVRKLEF